MIKTCKRCENEPKLDGLDVGPKCLEALRAELAEVDRAMARPEHERLDEARIMLLAKLEPLQTELASIERRLDELAAEQRAADEAEALAKAEAEANEAIARLEAEVAAAKAEIEASTARAAEVAPVLLQLEDAPDEVDAAVEERTSPPRQL